MGIQIFDFEAEQLAAFAGALAKGNMIEALRLAITDKTNLCGVHEDQQNDDEFPAVPVFSTFIVLDG